MGSISVAPSVLFGGANPPETIEEVIFQALGAASVCWETPEGAGVFDSDRAKTIGYEVLAFIKTKFDPKEA